MDWRGLERSKGVMLEGQLGASIVAWGRNVGGLEEDLKGGDREGRLFL